MGVIKKVLYRNNIIRKQRHKYLFVDMEENIHIHYRDLRIEFSRAEFEEFVSIFSKQSAELCQIILDKSYQDGKFANANQDDVRIWTEAALKNEVKYHPHRFSLEECADGYHFHYRNYKILIDEIEFRQIASAFRNLDVDSPYAQTYDEVLALLKENDVDFVFASGNAPDEQMSILVADYHLSKVRSIFKYIGFERAEIQGAVLYTGSSLRVHVKGDKRYSSSDYKRMNSYSQSRVLIDYLAADPAALDPDVVNHIKCQVLDVYYSLLKNNTLTVDLDIGKWLFVPGSGEVIFPYAKVPVSGKNVADSMYKKWSVFLAQLNLGFIKPRKHVLEESQQKDLLALVNQSIQRTISSCGAVSKVYVMGSAKRGRLGCYQVPFVHGKMVKLGSDIDVLIEIDERFEKDIPDSWTLVNPKSSNGCAIYHMEDIPLLEDRFGHFKNYPNIRFTQHLIDSYVHFPSHGRSAEKEAFLKRFGAQKVYDRAESWGNSPDPRYAEIGRQLANLWGIQGAFIEKMRVSTENELFKVYFGESCHVLKLNKAAGNYNQSRIPEHVLYEEQLIVRLAERGFPTPKVTPPLLDSARAIEACPAMLFERMSGTHIKKPPYPIDEVSGKIALLHKIQMDEDLGLVSDFTAESYSAIWLPLFAEYAEKLAGDDELNKAFCELAPMYQQIVSGACLKTLSARSFNLHCHGDVAPKNVMYSETGEAHWFDFNNAFYGPRMFDVIDGAFEFSLAEKYIHFADFSRFDFFLVSYSKGNRLSDDEMSDLPLWTNWLGIIKFLKEIRVHLQIPKGTLRKARALAIADFLLHRNRVA